METNPEEGGGRGREEGKRETSIVIQSGCIYTVNVCIHLYIYIQQDTYIVCVVQIGMVDQSGASTDARVPPKNHLIFTTTFKCRFFLVLSLN